MLLHFKKYFYFLPSTIEIYLLYIKACNKNIVTLDGKKYKYLLKCDSITA